MEVLKVRKFKNVKSKQALFPGYLFCRFDKEENLGHVRWTQGVKKLLPESVSPMSVDDEVVQAIHSLEQEDGVIRQQPLQKNDQVRIARGPMKDVLGVFDHWSSDQGRVRLLRRWRSDFAIHRCFKRNGVRCKVQGVREESREHRA
jgi:transcription antitermination factor NusG